MQRITTFQQIREAVAVRGPVEGYLQLHGFRSAKTFYATATGRLMMRNWIDDTTQRAGPDSPGLREYIEAGALYLEDAPYTATLDVNGTEDELTVRDPEGRAMASVVFWATDEESRGRAEADARLIVDALNAFFASQARHQSNEREHQSWNK